MRFALGFMIACCTAICFPVDVFGQKYRPIQKERVERSQRAEELKKRDRENFYTQERIAELNKRSEQAASNFISLSQAWGSEIRQFIRESPPESSWKGFREQLLSFDAHIIGLERRPSEQEINKWVERNISGGHFGHSKFRGVLRELSILLLLKAEGHTGLQWNRDAEPARIEIDGKSVDLGTRIIDIIARKPGANHISFFEIKNADLSTTLRKRELQLLERRTSVEELARFCDPQGSISVSREFREMVKDFILIKQDGREVEWIVRTAPPNLGVYLRHYGIALHLQH